MRSARGDCHTQIDQRVKWILNLCVSFFCCLLVLSCSRSAGRLLDPGLGHRDLVCRGAPHPCGAHGLLRAEKQRRQVCRYAAADPATRHVLHGKRSVHLSPGLGPLVVSLQEVNQNSTQYVKATVYQFDLIVCNFKGTAHPKIKNSYFSSYILCYLSV